jgi:hypothetical protein
MKAVLFILLTLAVVMTGKQVLDFIITSAT